MRFSGFVKIILWFYFFAKSVQMWKWTKTHVISPIRWKHLKFLFIPVRLKEAKSYFPIVFCCIPWKILEHSLFGCREAYLEFLPPPSIKTISCKFSIEHNVYNLIWTNIHGGKKWNISLLCFSMNMYTFGLLVVILRPQL